MGNSDGFDGLAPVWLEGRNGAINSQPLPFFTMDRNRILNTTRTPYMADEGYESPMAASFPPQDSWVQHASLQDKEELAYILLSSLPISNLARLQRKIAPLLQLDIIGLLPTELALHICSYLPYQTLLICALVSRRWRVLVDDPSLWKRLCIAKGWQWRDPPQSRFLDLTPAKEFDDEGVGEDEDEGPLMDVDSGFTSMSSEPNLSMRLLSLHRRSKPLSPRLHPIGTSPRYSAPPALPSQLLPLKPDYKLLHQTHTLLRNRFIHSSYRLTTLQTPHTPDAHSSTIYCLQLHTFPDFPDCPGRQVLFTGSRDTTIRQWDMAGAKVERVFSGIHEGSILSLCVQGNYIVSGGSDRKVVVWDLETGQAYKVIEDHADSVLGVRMDETRLVTCSKDRTVRTYLSPHFLPHLVLNSHRVAVNAVSISPTQIVSASGDRSIRLWDAETGALLRCFEGHHDRGIASIDFAPPYVLSGSSDRHLRFFNVLTSQSWSTSPYFEPYTQPTSLSKLCGTCGGDCASADADAEKRALKIAQSHRGLVRSVALGDEFALSGSYDQTIKVWDRMTGELIGDLVGGHSGKVFSVGFDCTKIVSCGEDQRICIWDFAHGIDTSFIKL